MCGVRAGVQWAACKRGREAGRHQRRASSVQQVGTDIKRAVGGHCRAA